MDYINQLLIELKILKKEADIPFLIFMILAGVLK